MKQRIQTTFQKLKDWWSRRNFRGRALTIAGIALVFIALIVLIRGGSDNASANVVPTVTVQSINSLGGTSNGVYVTGKVTSVNEADLLAQSAGTVTAVNAKLGQNVPAGFVIASLDSASQQAAVLQAQGAYDAALAAQQATNLQAQNSTGSLADQETSVRTLYQTDYTTAQNTLVNDVDAFFGENTAVGPQLLINPLSTGDSLPRERRAITDLMLNWQSSLASTNSTDPLTLLSKTQSNLTSIATLLNDLSRIATQQGSDASASQLADLSAAQSTINGLLSGVSSARTAYNSAATAAAVGQTQKSGGQGVTSSEASVEQALGGLRAAQAAYEKTQVRAPLAGTINYLQIHVGDFVSMNEHVATVARNNSLKIVLELSQKDAERLQVGDTVTVNSTDKGVVTTIAPALDPTTQQIEVDVAVDNGVDLVDGQSVQVLLPSLPTNAKAATTATTTTSAATTTTSVLLPLTAVKLLPSERDIFTVDASGHLVSHPVTIGDVIGDRIEVLSPLDPSLQIVVDARGLSAGDAVQVSTSTPTAGQ